MAVSAAQLRDYKVVWFEVQKARTIYSAGQQMLVPAPSPKRRATFTVTARTVDTARRGAREHVQKRLRPNETLHSVNFTTRANELVIYTGETKEQK